MFTTGQTHPNTKNWNYCNIYFNNFWLDAKDASFIRGVAAHEFGHEMGLAHYNTNPYGGTMKKTIIIYLILLLSILTIACAEKTTSKKNNKEVIEIGGSIADFIRSYDSTAELSSESDIIFKGKVQSILSRVEDNDVISLVVFDIENVYQGDKSKKTIKISIMGGLMDGDEFVHSSIGKMFIEKGASEEELSSLYSGKNVRFAGLEGEMIPTEGESYIVFARNSIVKKDIYYIVGGGYDQGLLPIIDKNKVKEFNPEKRKKKVELNNISTDQLIDESK